MTGEEMEKKKKDNIISTFVTSCSTNMKETTKIIALVNNDKELFSSLGLNVNQVKSLLSGIIHFLIYHLLLLLLLLLLSLARKVIDQTLYRIIEERNQK